MKTAQFHQPYPARLLRSLTEKLHPKRFPKAARYATNNGKAVESGDATPRTTLSDLKITGGQSSKWQKLAAIPKREFDDIVSDPVEVPTTQG